MKFHSNPPHFRPCLQDDTEWADTAASESRLPEEATDDVWDDVLSDALAALQALLEAWERTCWFLGFAQY